jgi:hypothetical protein
VLPFRDVKDDGTPGLYLRILKSGTKSWVMRYKISGRTRVGTIGAAGERLGRWFYRLTCPVAGSATSD